MEWDVDDDAGWGRTKEYGECTMCEVIEVGIITRFKSGCYKT